MAYINDTDATDFGYMLGWFDCSENISGTGEFEVTNIFFDTAPIINQRACFSQGTDILNSLLTKCNIHFIVGFNTQGGAVDHGVKFTYNLHAYRTC